MIGQGIAILLLILLSAVFSSSETAFTSLSAVQVRSLVSRHGRRGRMVETLSGRPDTLLTTILIGNNLVNIGASAIATQLTIALFGSTAVGIMTGVLTLIILIFAEVTPKQLAIIHNEKLCLTMAYPIYVLSIVLWPFIKLIGLISSAITSLFSPARRERVSLEGILHMVHLAESEGVVERYETRMIKSVFRFNDTKVQTIMTHRTDIFSLEQSRTLAEVLPAVTGEGYSRIPVYDKNPEHVVGILLVREMMKYVAAGQTHLPLWKIMTEPIFVSETRRVSDLFFLFKREKLNLAVVMDEYGGLAGVVTLEDVAEELFGELYDENERQGWEKITDLGEGRWRVTGDTSVYQLADRFDIKFPQSKYAQTLAGFLIEQLDSLPVQNQKIETPRGVFKIEKVRNNRIESVIFVPRRDEAG
jgi:CBS domain containing-hemolysin-like protein